MDTRAGWLLVCMAVASPAVAERWETLATGPVVIKSRTRPGTQVREIWAEGDMSAPVRDVQAAIMDTEAYPRFMPFVKESRYVGQPAADGSGIVYGRVEPPVIGPRDYVLEVVMEKGVAPDGSGTFLNRWVALPDRVPRRANAFRLRVNEGSWEVRPLEGGRSHVTYRFALDPGGWLPAFVADIGNRGAVMDTFKAIEREARRRAAARDNAPPR